MEGSGTELDFLDDLSPLSQALIQTAITSPSAYANLPQGSFVVINAAICFKKFEARFLAGIGEANLSRTLEQIRETSVFPDLTSVWDNSEPIPLVSKKRVFSLESVVIYNSCGNIAVCLKLTWNNPMMIWMKAI